MPLSNAERQARHRAKLREKSRAAKKSTNTEEQSRRQIQAMIEQMANARYVAGAQRALSTVILDRDGTDSFGFGKKALREVQANTPLSWSDIFDLIEKAGFHHWSRYFEEQSEDVLFVKPALDRRQRERRREFLQKTMENFDRG